MTDRDDNEEENERSDVRYVAMPTLQAMQMMRNRMQMAKLGKRLMKWKAVAATRELCIISESLVDSAERVYGTDIPAAYMLLARCRYIDPGFTKFILQGVQGRAQLRTTLCKTYVAGVKVISFEHVLTGRPPFELHSLPKAGRVLQETAAAFQKLLIDLIGQLQSRDVFTSVEESRSDATRKMNVMAKVVIPRALATIAYIQDEMEERGREDYYRMKKIIYIKNKRLKDCRAVIAKDKKIEHEREKSYMHLLSRFQMGLPLYEVDSDIDDDNLSETLSRTSFGRVGSENLSHIPLTRVESQQLLQALSERVDSQIRDMKYPPGIVKKKRSIEFREFPRRDFLPETYLPPIDEDPVSPPRRDISPENQLPTVDDSNLHPYASAASSSKETPQAPRYPIELPTGVPIIICGGYILPMVGPGTLTMPGTQTAESPVPSSGCRVALLVLGPTDLLARQTQVSSPEPVLVSEANETQATLDHNHGNRALAVVEPLVNSEEPTFQTEPLRVTLSIEISDGRTTPNVLSQMVTPMGVCRGNRTQATAGPLAICWTPDYQREVSKGLSTMDVCGGRTTPSIVSQTELPMGICGGNRAQAAAGPLAICCGPEVPRPVSRGVSPIDVCRGRTTSNIVPEVTSRIGVCGENRSEVAKLSSLSYACGGRRKPDLVFQTISPLGVSGGDRPQVEGSLSARGLLDSQRMVTRATSPIVVCGGRRIPDIVSQTITAMGVCGGNSDQVAAESLTICKVHAFQRVVSRGTSPLEVCGGRRIPDNVSPGALPLGMCSENRPQASVEISPICGVACSQRAILRSDSSIEVCGASTSSKPASAIPKTFESYNRYMSLDRSSTLDRGTAVLCRRCATIQEKEFKRNMQHQNLENARGKHISTDDRFGRGSVGEVDRLEVSLIIPHFLLKTINGIKIITDFFIASPDSNENVGVPVNSSDVAGPSCVCPGGTSSSGGYPRREVSITEIEDIGCQCDLGSDEQVNCPRCSLMNARGATVRVRSSNLPRDRRTM